MNFFVFDGCPKKNLPKVKQTSSQSAFSWKHPPDTSPGKTDRDAGESWERWEQPSYEQFPRRCGKRTQITSDRRHFKHIPYPKKLTWCLCHLLSKITQSDVAINFPSFCWKQIHLTAVTTNAFMGCWSAETTDREGGKGPWPDPCGNLILGSASTHFFFQIFSFQFEIWDDQMCSIRNFRCFPS